MCSKLRKGTMMNQSSSKNLKSILKYRYTWLQHIQISWIPTEWWRPKYTTNISYICQFICSCQSRNWSKSKHRWKEYRILKCKQSKDFWWLVSLLYIEFQSSTELYFAPWIMKWKCFWISSLIWLNHSFTLFALDHFRIGWDSRCW